MVNKFISFWHDVVQKKWKWMWRHRVYHQEYYGPHTNGEFRNEFTEVR